MAKTAFVDNVSKIMAAFANSIYGTGASGGHVHDGVDNDGHCGKIDFFNHVANDVPATNFGVKITNSELAVEQTANIVYEKHQRLVIINIPTITGISNATSLTIVPQSGNFPAVILPTNNPQVVPVTLWDNGLIVPGIMFMTATLWQCSCLGAASDGNKLGYGTGNFAASGTKGISNQSIIYTSEIV
jgi:hypothetical protein